MFMVAASVVTTILILNYHHRKTETHEMPQWVSVQYSTVQYSTVQYSTVQYSTVQRHTRCHSE